MWRQTIDVLHAALLKNRNGFSDNDPLTVFNPEFALGIPEIIGGGVKRVKKVKMLQTRL